MFWNISFNAAAHSMSKLIMELCFKSKCFRKSKGTRSDTSCSSSRKGSYFYASTSQQDRENLLFVIALHQGFSNFWCYGAHEENDHDLRSPTINFIKNILSKRIARGAPRFLSRSPGAPYGALWEPMLYKIHERTEIILTITAEL